MQKGGLTFLTSLFNSPQYEIIMPPGIYVALEELYTSSISLNQLM